MKAQSLRLISVNNFKVQIALLQQFIFDNKNLKKKKVKTCEAESSLSFNLLKIPDHFLSTIQLNSTLHFILQSIYLLAN